MSELNKYGIEAETWATFSEAEKKKHYCRWYRSRIKLEPHRDAEMKARRRDQQRRYLQRLKLDPIKYEAYVERMKAAKLQKSQADAIDLRPFGVTTHQWEKLKASQKTNFLRKFVALKQLEDASQSANGGQSAGNRYGIRDDVWRGLPESEKRHHCAKLYRAAIEADPSRLAKFRSAQRAARIAYANKCKGDPVRMEQVRQYRRDRYRQDMERYKELGQRRSRKHYWRHRDRYLSRARERYQINRTAILQSQRDRWHNRASARAMRISTEQVCRTIQQSMPQRLPKDVRDELIARMSLAILEGKLDVQDIGVEVRDFLTAYNREFDTFKILSLNAPVRGRDGITYLDLLEAQED